MNDKTINRIGLFILFSALSMHSCNDINGNHVFSEHQINPPINLLESDTLKYKNHSLKELLVDLSSKALQIGDFEFDTLSANWIGSSPATDQEILLAEKRLDVELPEDYKEFLKISNGFPDVNGVEPSFMPINEIDYLYNSIPFLVEIWGSKSPFKTLNGDKYDRAILVGGLHEEQQFLLIPPAHEYAEWEYWKFASWIPGEEVYESLRSYFVSSLDFCDYLIEEQMALTE